MKRFEISVPDELYEEYAAAAAGIGLSVSSWAKTALASYYSRWRSPKKQRESKGSGSVAAEQMWCEHPACDLPADKCRNPEFHRSLGMWSEGLADGS